jgi:hypothetical protein
VLFPANTILHHFLSAWRMTGSDLERTTVQIQRHFLIRVNPPGAAPPSPAGAMSNLAPPRGLPNITSRTLLLRIRLALLLSPIVIHLVGMAMCRNSRRTTCGGCGHRNKYAELNGWMLMGWASDVEYWPPGGLGLGPATAGP